MEHGPYTLKREEPFPYLLNQQVEPLKVELENLPN